MKEPILEPILRKMRLAKVLPTIMDYKDCVLLDVGCGWEAKLLHSVMPHISKGVGIDFKAPVIEEVNKAKLETISITLEKTLPFESQSFDVVTMIAVLEHLEHPFELVGEINRVLKPGGSLVMTVPSVWSQPVLEFLSSGLGVVSKDEIADHKLYHNRLSLEFIAKKTGFTVEGHRYFQLYMNNFCVFKK
jgi:2-polyprenyl-3-methyl-5-hydroxy-6-metoxy-1,4-benzoquinol methylase